ncbi:MAG: hypothetical protein HYV60_05165, partial [Planctomycetia bacterium]|nr:hypothetical protein [Planctomycetia bacterium]
MICSKVFIAAVLCAVQVTGQPSEKVDGWLIEHDEQDGIQIHTMELTLHPRAEPIPALKYHLIPDDFDLLDGNAATYYLKAQGFFEQTPARERLSEMHAKARDQARRENRSTAELPPYVWQSMTPDELPVEEVKEFLTLLSFQPMFLKEAAKQRQFQLDRHIRTIQDPINYLLPEVQSMREIARMQSLRCRVAIAEGRIDDALEILGQQYAMARHLGQDDFIVTTLVGVSISDAVWSDALYLVQRSDTPNLYWAFASLPRPLVDVRHAMSVERQFLYLQLKVLREVDEVPRPVGYWQDFLDRLVPQIGSLAGEFGLDEDDPETTRATLVAYIAAAYPGAKRYLIEDLGLSPEQVEAYPIAQVVFLAMIRFYDAMRDDYFKWTTLPSPQSLDRIGIIRRDDTLRKKSDRIGWSAMPTDALLPGINAVNHAVARSQQKLALVQTVEAIRMYGAANDDKLPRTLDDLPVPAPQEP